MIDSRAIIHPSAKLAADVQVGPWTIIGPDVEIGEGSVIASHVVIKGPTVIGKHNQIYQFSSVGEDTPDLKYKGEPTRLVVGDHNIIREGVTIHRGTVQDRSETTIGSYNLIMAYVHVGHDSVIGNHCILVNNTALAGHVYIGDWAILSGYTLVHQFCKIGAHVMVSGGSLVRKDVPPYTKAAREPISYVGINSVGLRRRGFSDDEIRQIEDIYRILYVKGYSISNAVPMIESEIAESPIKTGILEFINSSTNGIMKGYSRD